jgi:hypothetical protein
MLSAAGVGQHECPIAIRDRTSRAMPMSPCYTDRHDKHGVSGDRTKRGICSSVEMNNLKGKCSFRDESDGCVDCADQADELDPTDRVIARKSGRHG